MTHVWSRFLNVKESFSFVCCLVIVFVLNHASSSFSVAWMACRDHVASIANQHMSMASDLREQLSDAVTELKRSIKSKLNEVCMNRILHQDFCLFVFPLAAVSAPFWLCRLASLECDDASV